MSGPEYVARILTQRQGGMIQITGVVTPPVSGPVAYRLVAVKTGRSGRSDSRQGGEVMASAGRDTVLSSIGLGVQPGDACSITLEVMVQGQPVAEARFVCEDPPP